MRAFAASLALLVGACTATPPTSAATPSQARASGAPASSSATASPDGLATVPGARGSVERRWYTVPDGLMQERAAVAVSFDGDATAGRPRARLRNGAETVPLTFAGAPQPRWTGTLSLAGASVGEQTVEFVVRLASGTDAVAATATFLLSAPEYVVWTLDFEGDAATDAALENTESIDRTHRVPMTLMWNPRVWTTSDVPAARAEAMRQWTMRLAAAGRAEVALHIHAWTDYVRAAGVTPRTTPSWAGRGDGYDVPLTAFSEEETATLLAHALRLMAEHGMPRPTTFRAGGLFANAANLRAVAGAGFTVDTSATPAGPFGQLQLPWTLKKDAQPYRPSRGDANAAGDLPLLELPNIAGNTYGFTATSIRRTIDDDLAMLAPLGQPATERRVLTLVSHPATIDATERAAIEALFRALAPYRYDGDGGPLRFVTASQVAQAFK